MAHWSLITYTRPNTDIAWFTPSAEVMSVIDSFKNDNIIESYEKSESSDGLKQYYKIKFKNIEASESMRDNSIYADNIVARNSYCVSNDINCIVEQFDGSEPVIS